MTTFQIINSNQLYDNDWTLITETDEVEILDSKDTIDNNIPVAVNISFSGSDSCIDYKNFTNPISLDWNNVCVNENKDLVIEHEKIGLIEEIKINSMNSIKKYLDIFFKITTTSCLILIVIIAIMNLYVTLNKILMFLSNIGIFCNILFTLLTISVFTCVVFNLGNSIKIKLSEKYNELLEFFSPIKVLNIYLSFIYTILMNRFFVNNNPK